VGLLVTARKVKVSNDLVRCAQKLRLSEKRLLMLVVTKVTSDNIDSEIPVTAIEYAEFYNVDRKSCYQTMVAAHKKLWSRDFVMDGKLRRWVITCEYQHGEGCVSIRIHPDMKEHVVDLKECYTQYYLRRAGEFKLIYSWRLFEQLMRCRTTGKFRISLADFKVIHEVPASYSRDFSQVRHKVINPAMKEIRASGLPVKLTTFKKGRAVDMLEFTFPQEQQRDWVKALAKNGGKQGITKKYIEKHAKPGESYSEAQERLQRELDNQQKAANG